LGSIFFTSSSESPVFYTVRQEKDRLFNVLPWSSVLNHGAAAELEASELTCEISLAAMLLAAR
jgi:hypothetical protein